MSPLISTCAAFSFFVVAVLARAEEIQAASGPVTDWEMIEAWSGKDPAKSNGATFVIGQGAQTGPSVMAQAVYISSLWKGGDIRLDPGGELILTRPITIPKGKKLILNGGQIVTKEIRPVIISGDIEVTAESTITMQGDNPLDIRGTLTGGGALMIIKPAGPPRMIDFQGDLSKFTGNIQFSGVLISRFRNGDWGSGSIIFDSAKSKNTVLLSEKGFRTQGKLDLGGGARLDLENTGNQFGSLVVNGMMIDAGVHSNIAQLMPNGDANSVSRSFFNTEKASVKVGP